MSKQWDHERVLLNIQHGFSSADQQSWLAGRRQIFHPSGSFLRMEKVYLQKTKARCRDVAWKSGSGGNDREKFGFRKCIKSLIF